MSRLIGVLSVFAVLLLAMGFAAANAGHRVTLALGFITLYQVPVTLVAFSGLFLGMVVMFATGVHNDLKVRRILRDRLADESRQEQTWIDQDQQDLFAGHTDESGDDSTDEPAREDRGRSIPAAAASGVSVPDPTAVQDVAELAPDPADIPEIESLAPNPSDIPEIEELAPDPSDVPGIEELAPGAGPKPSMQEE